MSQYTEFFLRSRSSVVQLETLEISHPAFSRTYWVVRNATAGLLATLEDGLTLQQFDYYPLRIVPQSMRDNLDFGLKVDLGDLGELLPIEIDNVVRSES